MSSLIRTSRTEVNSSEPPPCAPWPPSRRRTDRSDSAGEAEKTRWKQSAHSYAGVEIVHEVPIHDVMNNSCSDRNRGGRRRRGSRRAFHTSPQQVRVACARLTQTVFNPGPFRCAIIGWVCHHRPVVPWCFGRLGLLSTCSDNVLDEQVTQRQAC